jgi:hypothetical protein
MEDVYSDSTQWTPNWFFLLHHPAPLFGSTHHSDAQSVAGDTPLLKRFC